MSEHLPICTACGTQFELVEDQPPSNCKICDDPRQFVPAEGQSWTTLAELRTSHKNTFEEYEREKITFIRTEPRFAIGQRAMLLETPDGNMLWDMISLIDDETIDFIRAKGRLAAIVISHPHYYTTYLEWAKAFDCPVWMSAEDYEWTVRRDDKHVRLIPRMAPMWETVVPGVSVIKTGGHFPGSLLLHWKTTLFLADTIVTVPSAYTPHPRPPGQTSFVFMWSIPNMIPQPPVDIIRIWDAVRTFEFDTTLGAFSGMNVHDTDLKKRMKDSMRIQIAAEAYEVWEEGDRLYFKTAVDL